jgi:hypothetical protein
MKTIRGKDLKVGDYVYDSIWSSLPNANKVTQVTISPKGKILAEFGTLRHTYQPEQKISILEDAEIINYQKVQQEFKTDRQEWHFQKYKKIRHTIIDGKIVFEYVFNRPAMSKEHAELKAELERSEKAEEANTLTVGELIDLLENYDRNSLAKIYDSNYESWRLMDKDGSDIKIEKRKYPI